MAYLLPSDIFETCSGGVLYCLSKWASDTTNGLFWAGILFAFVAVLLLATQKFKTPRSFGFASTIGMLGAIWLATLQLLSWWIATLFILGGAIGFAVLIINEK